MNSKDFDSVIVEFRDGARKVQLAKRPAYTIGNPDVLHNFKSVAERLGIRADQAWGVYFLKHVDAICMAVKDPTGPRAESLESRFIDAENYLQLGWALQVESLFEPEDADEPIAPVVTPKRKTK